MPAAQEFLINILVAASAISRRQFRGDYESVVFFLFLARCWLMALQAVHSFPSVHAHLVFMHYGILHSFVALRAFSSGPHQLRTRLLALHLWPRPVDQESRQNQCKCN